MRALSWKFIERFDAGRAGRVLCAFDKAAMRGRPNTELVLREAEHEQLTVLTLLRRTTQALARLARIVLACAEGIDNQLVASRQRVTPQTVSKWRARFVAQRWKDCSTLLGPARRA